MGTARSRALETLGGSMEQAAGPGGVEVRTSAGDACVDGTRARPVAPLIP